MCNPRRVMLHISRAIEEAWRSTVEQVASQQDEVRQVARLTADIPLDAEMGDLALTMFERVLQEGAEGLEPWQHEADGSYRQELQGLTLIYQPGSHQLIIEARLAETISVEVRAAAEASGLTVGEVTVDAIGHYYSDGWGGRTRQRAAQEARQQADQKLQSAIETLHRQQHAAELQAAEQQARAQAETQAAAELEQRREEVRAALRERLQASLAEAEDQVALTMNRLVGEAYRLSLIQMVQDNGGRVLSDERSGSVINLDLELF